MILRIAFGKLSIEPAKIGWGHEELCFMQYQLNAYFSIRQSFLPYEKLYFTLFRSGYQKPVFWLAGLILL